MNQVDKELMQEKGILTENEKADEYEIQKAAMKEAVFFLAAMLEKNLDMSELQTISLYLKELSMKQHYMHIHLYVQQLYRNSRPHPGKLCQFYVKDITDNEKQMEEDIMKKIFVEHQGVAMQDALQVFHLNTWRK